MDPYGGAFSFPRTAQLLTDPGRVSRHPCGLYLPPCPYYIIPALALAHQSPHGWVGVFVAVSSHLSSLPMHANSPLLLQPKRWPWRCAATQTPEYGNSGKWWWWPQRWAWTGSTSWTEASAVRYQVRQLSGVLLSPLLVTVFWVENRAPVGGRVDPMATPSRHVAPSSRSRRWRRTGRSRAAAFSRR